MNFLSPGSGALCFWVVILRAIENDVNDLAFDQRKRRHIFPEIDNGFL